MIVGQEEFDRLRTLSYADTHVIMLCFSVESRDSLENVHEKWWDEIARHCEGPPPCPLSYLVVSLIVYLCVCCCVAADGRLDGANCRSQVSSGGAEV